MAGREKRKRRRKDRERKGAAAPSEPAGQSGPGASAGGDPREPVATPSRDERAREQLVPLREGERPLAVTVGAVVAGLLVVGWVVALVTGDSQVAAATPLVLLLTAAAVGMWLTRYWAVLGFQALLALTLVNAILFLIMRADAPLDVIVGLLIVAAAGTLFWFLIRALARIQMPQRRTPG
jgi:hypothetical protein